MSSQTFLAAIGATVLGLSSLAAQTLYTPSGTIGTSSTSAVGVGTSSPAAILHVAGYTPSLDGYSNVIAKFGTAGAVDIGSITGNTAYIGTTSASANGLRFYTNGSTASTVLQLTNTGNVGIGTTSPAVKLHVVTAGAGTNDGACLTNGTAWLRIEPGTADNSSYNPLTSAGDNLLAFSSGTENQGGLVIAPWASLMGGIKIDGAGHVGIGAKSPSQTLDVNGSIVIPRGQALYIDRGGVDNPVLFQGNGTLGATDVIYLRNANGNSIYFQTSGDNTRMAITSVGNVGIGTTNPDAKLAVNGTIHAKEVIVDTSSSAWSDYVFSPGYRLASLSEVEQHIKSEGHLPGIPSAADVAEHGVTVGELQAKLLAKIEELTLHQIEQEKALSALAAENATLRRQLQTKGILP